MRVLHLLASDKYSGAENVVCQIIKMFDGDIEMAYCSPKGKIEETLKEKNIKYFPIESLSKKEILKVIKNYKPDVLHCHDLKATILGARIKNVKIISHVHGNKSNMSKLSLKSFLYNIACKKVDKIIWVSKSCFEDFKFKKSVVNKSIVLPNIISINDLITMKDKDENKYHYDIIYLGRLVYEKNPTRLIEIANKLKQTDTDFRFAIVGDGQYKQEIFDLIKKYNLEKNVECLGFKSNPYKLLADSKVMLMTSIMEGTPMCAIEAMSLGIPVVSTRTDGMVDLIVSGENGFLYTTDNEAVEHIKEILKDNRKIKKTTKNYAEIYNNVLNYKKSISSCYN